MATRNGFKGGDGSILQRVDELRKIEEELEKEDKHDQLQNVQVLLQAYRGGALQWHPGLVTYWHKGTQLCHPRPFYWKEFEVLNAHCGGTSGFWMEGVSVVKLLSGKT
jgi:hypothetical protein